MWSSSEDFSTTLVVKAFKASCSFFLCRGFFTPISCEKIDRLIKWLQLSNEQSKLQNYGHKKMSVWPFRSPEVKPTAGFVHSRPTVCSDWHSGPARSPPASHTPAPWSTGWMEYSCHCQDKNRHRLDTRRANSWDQRGRKMIRAVPRRIVRFWSPGQSGSSCGSQTTSFKRTSIRISRLESSRLGPPKSV